LGEFLTGTMAEVKAKDEIQSSPPPKYVDATQQIPKAPPPLCENCALMECENCELTKWWGEYRETVDDLILRSNIKGCLRKDRTCRARFPRPIFMKTEVDPTDSSINVKKHEPMINTLTPAVTYTMGC
ncbi:hypothetical protein B0H10DRAFT_1737997, partial [Mycena sp. CBHHK59/15]